MGSIRTITPDTARRLVITRQQLAGTQQTNSRDGLYCTVQELGCLQLDPISVVARSHELVLFSRVGKYDTKHIDHLLFKDRKLFEYWAHEASIVLTEDYPLYNVVMRNTGKRNASWAGRIEKFLRDNEAMHQEILDSLRQNGAMFSRQFKDRTKAAWVSSGWTSDHNIAQLLGMMWVRGEIMVAGRKGGQKLWDLTERCLPDWAPRDILNEDELSWTATQKSLRALGVGTAKHITNHFMRRRYAALPQVLERLEKEGLIERVNITGWPGTWYIHSTDLPVLQQLEAGEWQPRTTLLSPFDNLICDRARTELMFDFNFRIEIYVPKAKRQYGYYVLPILHGDQLIGRIDPLMDRKNKRLVINAVYAEPTAPTDKKTVKAVSGAIQQLAKFLGAEDIVYTEKVPDGWKSGL